MAVTFSVEGVSGSFSGRSEVPGRSAARMANPASSFRETLARAVPHIERDLSSEFESFPDVGKLRIRLRPFEEIGDRRHKGERFFPYFFLQDPSPAFEKRLLSKTVERSEGFVHLPRLAGQGTQ